MAAPIATGFTTTRWRVGAVALVAVAVLAGCGASEPSFPSSPHRLVTDGQLSTDVMLSLGFKPVAAVGSTPTGWAPALTPYLHGVGNLLGSRPGTSQNMIAIGDVDPSVIVAPVTLKQEGWASQLAQFAPTFYYPTLADPPLGPRGAVESTWKTDLLAVAGVVGFTPRADAVIAALDLRAAAIRPQVAGKTVGLIAIGSSQSFSTVDDYDPAATVYEQDLDLRNLRLRPQQYGFGCAPRPVPPRACVTDNLDVAIASFTMTGADALLIETGAVTPTVAKEFEQSPYFRVLPVVRAGHTASATTYEELGPLGVAFEYSAIEQAFGIDEDHAALAGGAEVDITLERSSRHVCWSTSATTPLSLALAGASIRITPANGCLTVSRATATALGSAPLRARVGGVALAAGAPSVVARAPRVVAR